MAPPRWGEVAEAQRRQATRRAFGFRLCGDATDDVNERGEPIPDDTLLVLLNAEPESVEFVVPTPHPDVAWEVMVDPGDGGMPEPRSRLTDGSRVAAVGRSLKVLRAWKP